MEQNKSTTAKKNLANAFVDQMRAGRDRELLTTTNGDSYTYGDAEAASARIASALVDQGVQAGDRVTVQVEKSPMALFLYLACLRGGFVFHPLNTGYTSSELAFFLADAEPALVVCRPNDQQLMSELAPTARILTLDNDGSGSLADHSVSQSPDFPDLDRSANDLAALLYSSGTTGVPKGIMLTHRNLLSNAQTLVQAWQFSPADRLLHALPIFHVHGLFVAIGCVLLSGASMRWLPKFETQQVLNHLPECSVMMGVPTYYTRMLSSEQLNTDTCQTMRLFISGSAPLLSETFIAFEDRTGHCILERYGMTETNMNTSNPLNGERIPGTVGQALPGVEVRVMDDEGILTPAGDIGNLQVKGENVFAGYWNLPDKTAEDFTSDGYFCTGDLARIDENAYVTIVGRSKDLIISGGLNIYPKEVESILDDLHDVNESAVIGVPHPDFGETVVAVIVPEAGATPGADAIDSEVRKLLAGFKCPRKYIFAEELPRNTMAKVQKAELRSQYSKLFA